MDTTFILFKKGPSDKQPVWVETVEGFGKARDRFEYYTANFSREEYFVFDVYEAKIVNIVLTKTKSA